MTSTVKSLLSRSHSVTRLASFVEILIANAIGFVRAILNRRDVNRLMELNERELKDIGLVRNDVLGALSLPLYRDPSSILLVRSVERRARARETAEKAMRAAGQAPGAKRPIVPMRRPDLAETGLR